MKRRDFIKGVALAAGAMSVGLSASEAKPNISETARSVSLQDLAKATNAMPEITIYTAKKFLTMDPTNPEAKAVAVVNDRILAVGSLDELKAMAKGQPYRVNHSFDGKIVTPGFIAQHVHPFLGALALESAIISIEDWDLPGGYVKKARGHDEYIAHFKEELAKLDKKDPEKKLPLFTWGYHQTFHGKLNRKIMDAIESKRPIFVWHRSCHEFILNSGAIKLTGITKEFIDTLRPEARAMTDLEDGHFWETGLFGVLGKLAPYVATTDQFRHGLKTFRDYLHRQGITSASEPGGVISKPMTEIINSILGDESTPFRFYFLPDGKSLAERFVDGDLIDETEKLLSWGKGKCSYQPKQVKLFADGAIYSQLMQLREGYTDGHKGEWMMTPELYAKAFRKYWDAGYMIVTHVTGDAGLDMMLDNLELNMRRNPRYDHRTTAVHFGVAQPDQIKKIKRLGAIVSANPYYVTALADNYAKHGMSPERVKRMVPAGDLERAGVHFSYHSDMPMAPAQPLFLMDCGVNRISTSGKVSAPEQRVSRMAALRAVTIEGAYSWRMEKEFGSIEAGKLANFTILEENPLTVESRKIKDIAVWGTVLEGKVLPVKPNAKPKSGKDTEESLVSAAPFFSSGAATFGKEDDHFMEHGDCVCALNHRFALAMMDAAQKSR
ncbi:amidohydrolase [Nitratifractor salsuginis]|uniref:Amidohydrolase 3 n=1 Tax=Nitratifractor salsuginis (strain DSM 16511 / JCM 12458 / E9I37-1) TaxID=749222 RepID=E6WYU2_NITSE|nr:amidohydrolase [Nitratifractor salsuginis]ADV46528.1 Amidohydrolase 3 [Nitratifractor salsuginis DSM 16511]